MTPSETILIRLLAETDAVFLPHRRWRECRHLAGVLYQLRRDYRTKGLPWRSRATDNTTAKQIELLLLELSRDKLVRTFKPRTKTLGVCLTDAGDWHARALCGLPGEDMAVATLEALKRLEAAGDCATVPGPGWIPETKLADTEFLPATYTAAQLHEFQRAITACENQALPALARNWCVTNSDLHGRAYFQLTRAGERIVAAAPAEIEAGDLPKPVKGANALWQRELADATARLAETDSPNKREGGFIPLPVSLPTKNYLLKTFGTLEPTREQFAAVEAA